MFTWLVGVALVSFFAINFFDEIIEWAKDVFNSLSSFIKKAWVYIRRIPSGIEQMVRYIQDGTMYEKTTPKEVDWEEIVKMYKEGEIDEETFSQLKEKHLAKIGELNREN